MTKLLINELYKKLDHPGFFFTNIDGLDIPFSNNWRKIGVNLSGGADSALLAYVLCLIIETNKIDCTVDIISFIRCWNTRPWHQFVSASVYNWLRDRFPNIVHDRHTTYIPPEIEYGNIGATIVTKHYDEPLAGDAIIISSYNTFIAQHKKLDAVFNGITSNPPGITVPNRTFTENQFKLSELVIHKKSINSFLMRPFKYIQKDWIFHQYNNLGILELYNMTRSCEGDITTHDVIREVIPNVGSYEYGMAVPICGECDWCKERSWAEKQMRIANDK